MDVLNRAYIEVSSGIYGYNTAISRALQHMADQGIECATYKRGTRVVRYSIESCVRRDVLTATNKLANEVAFESVKELGAEYVYVSRHLGARVSEKSKIANHAGWQGKAYKIDGSDDDYKNLREETGYPDEIEGLSGVNCRHRIFPFFPGITVLPKSDFNEEESKKLYELTRKQRAKERAIRATKRKLVVAEAGNDEETARKLGEELIERQDDIASFCEDKGLVRQYERENVYFNSTKAKNAAKSNKIEPKSVTNSFESIENEVDYTNTNIKNGFTTISKRVIMLNRVSGAYNPHGKAATKHAEQYYEFIRSIKNDSARIASNTGMSKKTIETIKQYLFIDTHDLEGAIRRFDSDYMIAQSWQRLIDGKNILPHDLTLLHHEELESSLVKNGCSQTEAHIIASNRFNYGKEATEYYASLKKYRKE